MIAPNALRALVQGASVVLLLTLLARLFDPRYTTTPLISSQARGYYLAAFVILGLVIAVEVVRQGVDAPRLPVTSAGWSLAVGATTLILAGHAGPLPIIALALVAAAEAWALDASTPPDAPASAELLAPLLAVVLLWLALFGLLEFHLRWLLALPVAAAFGALAYLRFEGSPDKPLAERFWPVGVAGLATAQLVAAVSFLDAQPETGATLIVAGLAAVYIASGLDVNGLRR